MAKLPQNLENSGDTKAMAFLQYITSGVILVLFVGLIAIIVAYIALMTDVQSQKQSYIEIFDKINQQEQKTKEFSDKLDTITNKCWIVPKAK